MYILIKEGSCPLSLYILNGIYSVTELCSYLELRRSSLTYICNHCKKFISKYLFPSCKLTSPKDAVFYTPFKIESGICPEHSIGILGGNYSYVSYVGQQCKSILLVHAMKRSLGNT